MPARNPIPSRDRCAAERQRFLAKFDQLGSDQCWPWRAARSDTGYGWFKTSVGGRGAHRVAYELFVGPIPEGLQIDHLCRNRACVNPAHLEPVTHRENVLRGTAPAAMAAKKTHCPQGHEYSPENTHHRPNGDRMCRECHRQRQKRLAARKRLSHA